MTTEVSTDFAEHLNQQRGGWDRAMGLRFVRATADEVSVEYTVDEPHRQPYGIVHGGVHCGVIETVCSTAAGLSAMARGQTVVGIENHTSFVRAVRRGRVTVTATPLTRGRRSQLWEATARDDEGRVVACGPTAEVMGRIDLFPEAGPLEAGTVIDAEVEGHDHEAELTLVRSRAGSFRVPRLGLAPGARIRMRIRARDVMIAVKAPEGLSALNVLPGTVVEVGRARGPVVDIALDCSGVRIIAELTRHSVETLALKPGREVFALVKSVTFDQVADVSGLPGDGVASAH